MQEFTWPGRTAETELALDLEKAALRREFEQRLEECGTLAFRIARGVLHNTADAEDVAQEAMLRSYRQLCPTARPLAVPGMAGSNQLPTRAGSWTIHAPSANNGKLRGPPTCRSRPRRTSPRQTNSRGAYKKRWGYCQKNRSLFYYSQASMVTRSKRWRSYYSCLSAP